MHKLYSKQRCLDLTQPKIMGILNITPDSFSDQGKYLALDDALYQAEKMLRAGADIIDIGGESTRPMAEPVSLTQELDRVMPVIEGLRQRFDCWLSIDTSKLEVMQSAVDAGVDMVNDVRALSQPNALTTVAKLSVPVCLMHMQGEPSTMQINPTYTNVVEEVKHFLQQRAEICIQAGIKQSQIILDPGFGFGKKLAHNYQLLAQLTQLTELDYPVLVGMSRKRMIGDVTQRDIEQRAVGSATAYLLAVMRGAKILRVHDIEATVDALKIWQATENILNLNIE